MNRAQRNPTIGMNVEIMNIRAIIKTPFTISFTPRLVSSYVGNASGPVLSEDSGLLLLNGKEVSFQPDIFTQLSKQGLWDQSSFVRDIENGTFSLIVLRFDFWVGSPHERFTDEMLDVMRANYRLVLTTGIYWIYSYQNDAPTTTL